VLVEDVEAALAVHTHLSRLGRTSPEWSFPNGAPVAQIAEHLTQIAVFRLEPAAA